MSKPRLGLSAETADRYFVTWSEVDITASLKRALAVRKFALRLDYTTHTPMLFICKPNGEQVLWRILDTRKFRNAVVRIDESEVDVHAFINHVDESLAKLGFRVTLGHRKDRAKRQEALLLVVTGESRLWQLSMIAVNKGDSKKVVGEL